MVWLAPRLLVGSFIVASCGLANAGGALDYVPTQGGLPLNDVLLGRSERRDYKGSFRFFFALNPAIDQYVSGSMLGNGGVWESGLNDLFEALAAEARLQPRGHGQPVKAADSAGTPLVLDVGTNIGAFGLFVASLGYHLYAFEMQERIFTLVELSRRVNGYHRMTIFHTALWNETGHEVKFTPSVGNFGGTTVMNNVGEVSMRTSRLEEYVPQSAQIFFMKVDVENAEEYVLSGFADTLASGRVKHMVMETRSNQASLVGWFYDIGFSCGLYDRKPVPKTEFIERITALANGAYTDIYCKFVGKPGLPLEAAEKRRPGTRRMALDGVYTPGNGWR